MNKWSDRSCKNCGSSYTPTGPAQLYCGVCGKVKRAAVRKATQRRAALKRGVMVGVSSGGNQGWSKTHATYKNGTGMYKRLGKAKAYELGHCERCQEKLDLTNPYKWCTHHRDHNRMNNDISNLEILCKSCHQIEHKVHKNFSKGIV